MVEKALIIGLGVSGRASAEFLLSLGFEVVGVDKQKPKEAKALVESGVQFVEEGEIHSLKTFSFVVLSPGIPHSHPLVQKAIEEKVELVGEAELAFRHIRQKVVGITGTNGKTTVTSLVEHILTFTGRKAKALGNIGMPLTSYVLCSDPEEIVVAELSSYQLETMKTRSLDAAAVLNITPDHLDRYENMEEYAMAKARIGSCLKENGALYLYEEVVRDYSHLFQGPFEVYGPGSSFRAPFIQGEHDLANLQAAFLLCRHLGVREEEFEKALQTFQKPSHRIQFVRTLSEVSYYDDSKGTNIDAVIRAVNAMKGPVVLIVGGVDKGSSYMPWKEAFEGKVKQLFAIGQAASKIKGELGLFFNVEIVDSLKSAVEVASTFARPGDCVLLSPGCSSFDMFRDYKERGDEFQRCVCSLEERSKMS